MASAPGDNMSAPLPHHPTPELCVRGGAACYLCGMPLANGESAVIYRDDRFWEQSFLYHARCWEEADLPAKSGAAPQLAPAPAVELPETRCLACHAPIEVGDLVVREWVRGGRGVRIYHAQCVREERRV